MLRIRTCRRRAPQTRRNVSRRTHGLRLTLGDYEAMAHLGHYFAEKICGACHLALFDASSRPEQQAGAVTHLERALVAWKIMRGCATRSMCRAFTAASAGSTSPPCRAGQQGGSLLQIVFGNLFSVFGAFGYVFFTQLAVPLEIDRAPFPFEPRHGHPAPF